MCCRCWNVGFTCNLKPKTFDHQDIYQQFEIIQHRQKGFFKANSVASYGNLPRFLRFSWTVHTSKSQEYDQLNEAKGLDQIQRARLPELNFSLSQTTSAAVVVGKWYCPFMFIKDGTHKDQVDNSRYYEMTLEQYWEQIFTCENSKNEAKTVNVDAVVGAETVRVQENQISDEGKIVADGIMWFKSTDNGGGENTSVGLSLLIVERMKWEEERFGWTGSNERQVRVKRVEEFQGNGEWKKFGCYVLVERFVLKRMNGSEVVTFDFRHTKYLKCKWE